MSAVSTNEQLLGKKTRAKVQIDISKTESACIQTVGHGQMGLTHHLSHFYIYFIRFRRFLLAVTNFVEYLVFPVQRWCCNFISLVVLYIRSNYYVH